MSLFNDIREKPEIPTAMLRGLVGSNAFDVVSPLTSDLDIALATLEHGNTRQFMGYIVKQSDATKRLPALFMALVEQRSWQAAQEVLLAMEAWDAVRWVPWDRMIYKKDGPMQEAIARLQLARRKMPEAEKHLAALRSPAREADIWLSAAEAYHPGPFARLRERSQLPEWLLSNLCDGIKAPAPSAP